MFTTEDIEVLGSPVGNDRFIKHFVAQNFLKIMVDIGNMSLSPMDSFTTGYCHLLPSLRIPCSGNHTCLNSVIVVYFRRAYVQFNQLH